MSLKSSRLVVMVFLLMYKCSVANKFGNIGIKDTSGLADLDLREIQRQNQITKQILQNFLEKSLYGKRFSKPPSLLDILPNGIVRRSPSNNIQELLGNSTHEIDNRETLDGDETENVDSFYEDYLFEGGPEAELYKNPNNYFLINTQLVGNANMEIIDIVAC